ncbi:hypothetical protein V8C26DRAFT_271185 [Trichoderma gracile]
MAGTTIARRRASQGGAVRQPMLFLACQLQRRHGMSPTRLGLEQSDGDGGGMRLQSAPFYPSGAACQPRTCRYSCRQKIGRDRRDSGTARVENTDAELFMCSITLSTTIIRENERMTPLLDHH